jgi:hypothetical protein
MPNPLGSIEPPDAIISWNGGRPVALEGGEAEAWHSR